MAYTSTISPERRENLRRLRSEFEAAFDALTDRTDRSSPAYIVADDRYRAWIKAIDSVAISLLDDIDAFEAIPRNTERTAEVRHASANRADGAEVGRLLSEFNDHEALVNLIGAAPTPAPAAPDRTPRSRAMNIIGNDRAARLWSVRLCPDHQQIGQQI